MKRQSYATLQALLRQNQQRIRDLERQLAESRRQLEAAKRKTREARTEVKKLKSEVIKPQEVKVSTQAIKTPEITKPAKIEPINLDPVSSSISKADLKSIRMMSYYIPRFIQRLQEVYGAEATPEKLKQIQIKLLTLNPQTVSGVLKDFNLEEVFYDSDQWNADVLNEEPFDDIFVGIMAVTD